jgi:uncharacterized protein YeaO (DUF488 family)
MNEGGYVIDEKNKNKESLRAFRKYNAGENPLLCEVAQENVEYPLVILRAIEAEEAERNPKSELELYIRHYEDVLARGEASNEGTIRELEVSVFVNLTYSLLNIVQLATHAKSLMIHTTQQQGNLMNTIAVMQQQLQMAQQHNNTNRPGSSGSPTSQNASRTGSALNIHQRPSSPQQQQSNFVAALQHQMSTNTTNRPNSQSAGAAAIMVAAAGTNNNNNNSTTIFVRPASSSSSLHTTARPLSGRTPSAGLLQQTAATPNQQQQATSPTSGNHHHHFSVAPNDELLAMQQNSAAMPIARVVCRPNSARALTAARKAPRGLDEVGMNARLFLQPEETQIQQKPRPPTAPTNSSRNQQAEAEGQEDQIPYQNSQQQQQQPPGQRISVSHYWQGSITDADVGVGNAAQSVGPSTHGNNWTHATLGHQNFKQHARIDTHRPRHGKALQTALVSERIQTSVNASNMPHTSQHPTVSKRANSARALPTASSRVGHNVLADQASTRRGSTSLHTVNSMPTNWNQQRDEKWVLVEP